MIGKRWVVLAALTLGFLSGSIRGLAQNPLKVLPDNYKLIFENNEVTVIRARYGPHEQIPVHDHTSFAAVFVYLSDSGQVRIDHAEAGEKPISVVRPPTAKGSYRIAEGAAERHSILNLGDTSSEFLRVELKHAQLKLQEPFRGKAPREITGSLDAVEFSNPALQIERIICAAGTSCEVKPAATGSLLIALAPLTTGHGSVDETPMSLGAVKWLSEEKGLIVKPSASEPAHLLRILLPEEAK